MKIKSMSVLGELITYIEETKAENKIVPVFKLADLTELYKIFLSNYVLMALVASTQQSLKFAFLIIFPTYKLLVKGVMYF